VSTTVRGACLCGAVAFTVAPPYRWFAHCHCSMCRKQHGSLFNTSLGVAQRAFHWLRGADDIAHYRATAAFERPFCRHCGSKVPALSHDAHYWHVPAGSLDGDMGARPRAHIFVASRSPLAELDDVLPRHAAYPPGVSLPVVDIPRVRDTSAAISGGCVCGAVAFAADSAPRRIVNCYCSLCRRSRAAAFSSTLLIRGADFRWLRGADRVRRYALAAPRRYATQFCAECGSLAPSASPELPLAAIPAGAIDTPLEPLPAVHVYVGSKAPWYEIADAWPQFEALPPEPATGSFR
jgi:hypothetical protein